MGEIKMTVPRLVIKKGRFYWRATPAVVKLGFEASIPLGSDPVAAATTAREWNARVDAAIEAATAEVPAPKSVASLCALYRASDEFKGKRKSTQSGYRSIMNAIEE